MLQSYVPCTMNDTVDQSWWRMRPMSTPADSSLHSYNTIAFERKGRLLTMTLNRPDTLNAVNREMHEELAEAFTFAALDEHSDVVVLTGAGREFSAGGDLG